MVTQKLKSVTVGLVYHTHSIQKSVFSSLEMGARCHKLAFHMIHIAFPLFWKQSGRGGRGGVVNPRHHYTSLYWPHVVYMDLICLPTISFFLILCLRFYFLPPIILLLFCCFSVPCKFCQQRPAILPFSCVLLTSPLPRSLWESSVSKWKKQRTHILDLSSHE